MKEDYLWDKTGADPEIEKLENALSAFRYDENSLPMPVGVHSRAERRPFLRFVVFGFAGAAACIAVAVISWTLWNRAPVRNSAFPDQVETFTPPAFTVSPEKALDKPAVNGPSRVPVRTAHRKGAVKKPLRQAGVAARARTNKTDTVNLTKEEIYAYNRLVLALSITSDKLNLVKEKITGE